MQGKVRSQISLVNVVEGTGRLTRAHHLVKWWFSTKLHVANLYLNAYCTIMNLLYSYNIIVISLLMHIIITCLVLTCLHPIETVLVLFSYSLMQVSAESPQCLRVKNLWLLCTRLSRLYYLAMHSSLYFQLQQGFPLATIATSPPWTPWKLHCVPIFVCGH